MKRDYIYIALIFVAIFIGYIAHPTDEQDKIKTLETDVKVKQKQINKLSTSFDSLVKVIDAQRKRITQDSIHTVDYMIRSSKQINILLTRSNNVNFKNASDRQLDSLINNLYPGANLLPAPSNR